LILNNELESLVEQQNNEIVKNSEDIKIFQKEIKAKDGQLTKMSDYIAELEKQLKNEEHKMYQKEIKMKKMKQGQVVEMSKKIRDQQNQIDILKEMVSGNK